MIKFHLRELIDSRELTIRESAKLLDYRFDTVRQMYHGETKRVPVELLDRICEVFECEVGDIISYKR